MIPFFKRYSIYVCIIAVALPVIYSTIYPMITGQIAASSLGSTVVMFLLFVMGLLLGFGIFERKAQAKADEWVALYNDDCDPEAFMSKGGAIAENMKPPYGQVASWYMSYFAQAKLDVGDVQDAKEILVGMAKSVEASKKPMEKLAIVVNAIPLAEKIEGPSKAGALISEGFTLCDQCRASDAAQYREFLESQKAIMEARSSGDDERIASLDDGVWQSSRYPKRIRVEYAWDAASADYKLGRADAEKKALAYVADNGGTLVLTAKAKERLKSLA